MRCISVSFVALALLLTSCGSSDNDDRAQTIRVPEPGTAAATTPAPQATTVVQRPNAALPEALLRFEDLPTGWTQRPVAAASGPDPQNSAFCGQRPFQATAMETAKAEFERDAFNTIVYTLASYRAGVGKQVMDQALIVFASCTEWTDRAADGTTSRTRLSPLSFPKLGDQTAAIRMTVEEGSIVIQADLVYIRRGDVVGLVMVLVGGLGNARVDSAVTEQLARKADTRLRGIP